MKAYTKETALIVIQKFYGVGRLKAKKYLKLILQTFTKPDYILSNMYDHMAGKVVY